MLRKNEQFLLHTWYTSRYSKNVLRKNEQFLLRIWYTSRYSKNVLRKNEQFLLHIWYTSRYSKNVLRKNEQFLLHIWYTSRYSKNKRGDKSWIRKGRIVITTSGIYPWSFMTHIFRNSSPEKLASRRRQAKQKYSTLPRLENYTKFWLVKTPGIKKNIFPDVARPCYRV